MFSSVISQTAAMIESASGNRQSWDKRHEIAVRYRTAAEEATLHSIWTGFLGTRTRNNVKIVHRNNTSMAHHRKSDERRLDSVFTSRKRSYATRIVRTIRAMPCERVCRTASVRMPNHSRRRSKKARHARTTPAIVMAGTRRLYHKRLTSLCTSA